MARHYLWRIDLGDDLPAEREMRRSNSIVVTCRPEGMPDTISRAVAKLKSKTLTVASPRQFAMAIGEIERALRGKGGAGFQPPTAPRFAGVGRRKSQGNQI